jgi:DNA-binding transcriptional LysR family regulator
VDLNLLLALEALLEDNSVAGAAHRLHLSSPAVSRTLSRIREATGDDILVRTGRAMVPTPHALAIRDEVRSLVQRARSVLEPARALDLATLERVFSIQGHDALIAAVAPELTLSVLSRAPHVQLRFLAEGSGENVEAARRSVDLELGSSAPTSPAVSSEQVGTDRPVVAMRRGHPLATAALTAKRFAAATHVTVSRRGRLHGHVDELLANVGLQRRVIASLPTSAAALEVVARTDHVTVVPEVFCAPLCAALGLVTMSPPLNLPAPQIMAAWHCRYDGDAAHVWLRTQVRAVLVRRLAGASASNPRARGKRRK